VNRTSRRRAGVLALTLAVALSAAACGGSSTSSGSSTPVRSSGASSTYVSDKLSLARCLRAHGVPNYPDPNAAGQEPPGAKQLITTPQGQAAVGACTDASNRVHGDVAAQTQAVLAGYVRFAQCMRSHGLPGFPDPVVAEGRAEFMLSPSQDGFDPHSSQVLAKAHACEHVLPAGSGLPEVEVAS
jgi:hypothetical protein